MKLKALESGSLPAIPEKAKVQSKGSSDVRADLHLTSTYEGAKAFNKAMLVPRPPISKASPSVAPIKKLVDVASVISTSRDIIGSTGELASHVGSWMQRYEMGRAERRIAQHLISTDSKSVAEQMKVSAQSLRDKVESTWRIFDFWIFFGGNRRQEKMRLLDNMIEQLDKHADEPAQTFAHLEHLHAIAEHTGVTPFVDVMAAGFLRGSNGEEPISTLRMKNHDAINEALTRVVKKTAGGSKDPIVTLIQEEPAVAWEIMCRRAQELLDYLEGGHFDFDPDIGVLQNLLAKKLPLKKVADTLKARLLILEDIEKRSGFVPFSKAKEDAVTRLQQAPSVPLGEQVQEKLFAGTDWMLGEKVTAAVSASSHKIHELTKEPLSRLATKKRQTFTNDAVRASSIEKESDIFLHDLKQLGFHQLSDKIAKSLALAKGESARDIIKKCVAEHGALPPQALAAYKSCRRRLKEVTSLKAYYLKPRVQSEVVIAMQKLAQSGRFDHFLSLEGAGNALSLLNTFVSDVQRPTDMSVRVLVTKANEKKEEIVKRLLDLLMPMPASIFQRPKAYILRKGLQWGLRDELQLLTANVVNDRFHPHYAKGVELLKSAFRETDFSPESIADQARVELALMNLLGSVVDAISPEKKCAPKSDQEALRELVMQAPPFFQKLNLAGLSSTSGLVSDAANVAQDFAGMLVGPDELHAFIVEPQKAHEEAQRSVLLHLDVAGAADQKLAKSALIKLIKADDTDAVISIVENRLKRVDASSDAAVALNNLLGALKILKGANERLVNTIQRGYQKIVVETLLPWLKQ